MEFTGFIFRTLRGYYSVLTFRQFFIRQTGMFCSPVFHPPRQNPPSPVSFSAIAAQNGSATRRVPQIPEALNSDGRMARLLNGGTLGPQKPLENAQKMKVVGYHRMVYLPT